MARSKNRKSRRNSRAKNNAAPKDNQPNRSGRNTDVQSGTVKQDIPSSEGAVAAAPREALSPASLNGTSTPGSMPVSADRSSSVSRRQGNNDPGSGMRDSGFFGISSSESSAIDDFDDIPLDPSSLDLWFFQDTSALEPLPETEQDDPLFKMAAFENTAERAQASTAAADSPGRPSNSPGKNLSSAISDIPGKKPSISSVKNSVEDTAFRPDTSSAGQEAPGTSGFSATAGGASVFSTTAGGAAGGAAGKPAQMRSSAAAAMSSSAAGSAVNTSSSSMQGNSSVSGPPSSARREPAQSAAPSSERREPAQSAAPSPAHREPAQSAVPPSERRESAQSAAPSPARREPAVSEAASYNQRKSIPSPAAHGPGGSGGPGGSNRTPQTSRHGRGFPPRKTGSPLAEGDFSVRRQQPAFARQIPVYSATIRVILTAAGMLFCLLVVMYFRARNAGITPNLGIIQQILEKHQENVEPNSSSDENADTEPDADSDTSPDSIPEDSAVQDSQEAVNTEQSEEASPVSSDDSADQQSAPEDNGFNAENTDNVDSIQNGYIEEGQSQNDMGQDQDYGNGNPNEEGVAEDGDGQLDNYYQEGNGYYGEDGRYYEEVDSGDVNGGGNENGEWQQ